MSTDEEMAIFGRMVLERQQLNRRGVALHEEIQKIAKALGEVGLTLETSGSIYAKEFLRLSGDQLALLDASKITALLNEVETVGRRYQEITTRLQRAGLEQ